MGDQPYCWAQTLLSRTSPAGLTAVITKIDSTHATLTLTGNALAHTNAADIANLTVLFSDSAFATLVATASDKLQQDRHRR
jgi:hypothetical protein